MKVYKMCGNVYSSVVLEAYDIYKMQIEEQFQELKKILGAIKYE